MDADAFSRLVEPYRTELHVHCYRVLGSLHDADDAMQETLLRAWRGIARVEGGVRVRPWLYRIATNVALDALARRPPRTLPLEHGAPAGPGDDAGEPGEALWLEPYPDAALDYEQREAVELAFVAALQHLPPRQCAVLILRDVLGFSAREAAEALDTSVAAVTSALARARRAVAERRPARSQQATLRALGDARVRALVERYLDAWERGDVAALAALLVEDATFTMPPYPAWWRGRDVIAAFASEPAHRYLATSANGQPANAAYRWSAERGRFEPEALEVLTLEGGAIAQMTAFMSPALFERFGLPDHLPARR